MITVFLAFASVAIRRHHPDGNGWGDIRKKIERETERVKKQAEEEARRARKRAEEEARRIKKQAEEEAERARKRAEEEARRLAEKAKKEVKRVTKRVEEFIFRSDISKWADPAKINSFEITEEAKEYSAGDLNTLIDTINSEFGVDKAFLTNYFKRARLVNLRKTLFNTINFGALNDRRNRIASLGCAVIKVIKNGNAFTVNVKKVGGVAKIFANTVEKTTTSKLGQSHSSTSESWRPLTGMELTDIYNKIQQQISDKVTQIRNI